ncbi:GNAT family N-acetyltransferase [Rhodobacter maris]|uniref:Acetyltransferase (GNAT) family protein n=1 Tax=Rhodobacter maris TaxID=446682 RepID=A0A285SA35_9RHOB|nr:GNAT family N-acetyltransferase [Rhodobacter maris]SOC02034.1 acetyltransferase (GNAT) family protein [Rhodobacter maris]
MEVRMLTGAALDAALDDVARLRIAVFRDWPYIYDGSLDYERRYLESYRASETAIVVGAFEGAQLVGAATGTPLEDHAEDFATPFANTNLVLDEVFYCAESVLLPAYRGQGLGHTFFEAREAHARALGRRFSAFCAVIRPETDPRKPAGYHALDGFWRKRGYAPMPGVVAHFRWTDLGNDAQTEKALQFWGKYL